MAVFGGISFRSIANRIYCTRKCSTCRRRSAASVKAAAQDRPFLAARDQARTLVLRSQCNDAYWHGVFGGLYSPHLRTALWRSLIQAESIADALTHRGRHFANAESIDFEADGRDEIYFYSDRYAALLSPDDGATISALDCRQSNAALINSLCRRPEAYHAGLKNLALEELARRSVNPRADAHKRSRSGALSELRSLAAECLSLKAIRPRQEI